MEETNKYSASCKQKDANAGDLTHNLFVMVMLMVMVMDTNAENTTEDTIHKHNVINDWFTSVNYTSVMFHIRSLGKEKSMSINEDQCQSSLCSNKTLSGKCLNIRKDVKMFKNFQIGHHQENAMVD